MRDRWSQLSLLLLCVLGGVVFWLILSPRPTPPEAPVKDLDSPPLSTVPIPEIARREDLVGNRVVRQKQETSPSELDPGSDVQALRERLVALQLEQAEGPESEELPPAEGEIRESDARLARYTRGTVETHFAPGVNVCYSALLDAKPQASGVLNLELSIVGKEGLGAVILDVQKQAQGDINDPGFLSCVEDKLMALKFPAPPDGRSGISVTQSFELTP